MGIFKDDDVKDELMNGLDDANVDKDLLSQIFADDGAGDSDLEKALEGDSDGLDEDLDALLSEIEDIEESAKASVAKETEKKAGADAKKSAEDSKSSKKEDKKDKKKNEKPVKAAEPKETSQSDGSLTIISDGTTINGGISSNGDLDVAGTVNGDIEAKGTVVLGGAVMGSVIAADIEVHTPRLEGSLNSEGNIIISDQTVVIGDVTGASASIAGAVKGSVDVNGSVILESSAVIKGDIKAKSIQIKEGAIMDGRCVLSYSDVDIDEIFEEK